MNTTWQKYKSPIKPVWCPGCGDYVILRSLQQALADLEIPPHDIITVSGIGCSGRMSHYINSYSLHGTHGRALPTGLGAKAARPDQTVLVIGGDGDGLGIGGGHIVHAARKNIDLTYLLIDNRIYGLTKGQASPTTPEGRRTKTTPQGVIEPPMDVIPVLLSYDVSFVARTATIDIKGMTDIIKQAVRHRGLSIVHILSLCRTFPVIEEQGLKDLTTPLPAEHPKEDKMAAMARGYSHNPLFTGVFYQVRKPTLDEAYGAQMAPAQPSEDESCAAPLKDLVRYFT